LNNKKNGILILKVRSQESVPFVPTQFPTDIIKRKGCCIELSHTI